MAKPRRTVKMLKRLPLSWTAGSACALLLGLLAGPVALYWLGGRIIGEYPDPGGLLALWRSIYADAARLGPAGLVFLLAPLAMFQAAWALLFAYRKYFR